MPLPSGTWKANINGHETDLVLIVDAQGIVAATMFGIPFAGFWEEVRQTVSFSVSDAFLQREFDSHSKPCTTWAGCHAPSGRLGTGDGAPGTGVGTIRRAQKHVRVVCDHYRTELSSSRRETTL